MPNNNLSTPFDVQQARPKLPLPGSGVEPEVADQPLYSDEEILALWSDIKKESIDCRHPFEVQWRRNLYYILNRQWIEYVTGHGWRDKRMAPQIPRPVTNKCKDTLRNIRAVFTAIKLGVNVRPNGADPQNVSAAATADDLAPVLHEAHAMNSVLTEFDFWLIALGNAFLHTFVDYNIKHGMVSDPSEQCVTCGAVYKSSELAETNSICPDCGGNQFTEALDEFDQPIVNSQPKGRPTTLVLSPLEIAFPNSCARFEDVPYVVRMRWRTKAYFDANPGLVELSKTIVWAKSPSDQNLSLFQSLSTHNDLGVSSMGYSGGASQDEDGIVEYEVWMKPTMTYPEGFVFRIYGDGQAPLVAHLEKTEALPGPLPYKDADGQPLFTFDHAGYEPVGGRVLASGPIDAIIQKQDQLNQLDSMILLIINRMSNPVWLVGKGSEVNKINGMPGTIMRWNTMALNGAGKPERVPGEGPHASLFTIRQQYLQDIEDLTGASDALKGIKPSGDTPFSALQLLVERSQSSFALVFQARGDAYKNWFKFAIELEREFGPDERTKAILSPSRTWTFKTFKRSQLQGSLSVIVEDGSNAPKTNLGLRAAIEHAAGLGMVNLTLPDQQYEGLKLFGLTKMVPTLDIHVQSALQKQQAFEQWVQDPAMVQQFVLGAQQAQMQHQEQLEAVSAAPVSEDPMQPAPPLPEAPSILVGSPLELDPWFDPTIHKQELVKWANGDRMREIFQTAPIAKKLVAAHLAELDMLLQQQQLAQQAAAAGPERRMGGASKAMGNSNSNSGQGQGTSENGGPKS